MELKKIANKQLIYDGLNDKFYDEHTFKLYNGEEIKFSILDFIRLENLEKSNDEKPLLNLILKNCETIYRYSPSIELFGYKGQEDLSVKYKMINKHIVVLSLGESQPGRYKIYLEGIILIN